MQYHNLPQYSKDPTSPRLIAYALVKYRWSAAKCHYRGAVEGKICIYTLQWRHMTTITSQITENCIACSSVCPPLLQRIHRRSALLTLCERNPVDSHKKGPLTRKEFLCVIMNIVNAVLVLSIETTKFASDRKVIWNFDSLGLRLNIETVFPCMKISIIFIIGIPVLVRRLYIKRPPDPYTCTTFVTTTSQHWILYSGGAVCNGGDDVSC